MSEAKEREPDAQRGRFQFGIRAILLIMFASAFVFAVFSQAGSFFSNILLTILLANFVGAVVALFVTFAFGFPRDGSLRVPDDGVLWAQSIRKEQKPKRSTNTSTSID